MKEKFQNNWYWFILFMILGITFSYSIYRGPNQTYWDGALGNLLATLIGIIAGIPIALAIERQRIRRDDENDRAERQQRSKTIAILIRDELVENDRKLKLRLTMPSSLPRAPYKVDLRKVFCESGEIRWIDHPSVLAKVSDAYYYINTVSNLEDLLMRAVHGAGVRYGDGSTDATRLLESVRAFDDPLVINIAVAIGAIDAEYLA